MARLWLTDKRYPLLSYILRIAYWLLVIYISNLYLQHTQQESWFKIGLIVLSTLFVIIFLRFTRFLDRIFKVDVTD